jgi:hypothetical protein
MSSGMTAVGILLHGFGQRYDLPASLALYLYAAAGVVVTSFVLVVVFWSDQVGSRAVRYPRRAIPLSTRVAQSPVPRLIGGVIGLLALAAIVITGLVGLSDPTKNPAEYLTWVYFWAMTVIASGLVGNLWYLLHPWADIYDAATRVVPLKPAWKLPNVGMWPAGAFYFSFACLELTSGRANRPWLVASAALTYTCLTLAGMVLFGRDEWLDQCEAFTVLFNIVCRFGPIEAGRDDQGRVTAVYARPWGVGLLQPLTAGLDRVVFVRGTGRSRSATST